MTRLETLKKTSSAKLWRNVVDKVYSWSCSKVRTRDSCYSVALTDKKHRKNVKKTYMEIGNIIEPP